MTQKYIVDFLFILNDGGLPLLVFESEAQKSSENKTPDPMQVGFLSTNTVTTQTDIATNPLNKWTRHKHLQTQELLYI